MSKKKKIKKKKVKIKYKNVFFFLVFMSWFLYLIYLLIQMPIKSIYITGNRYIEDEKIIEFGDLKNYPSLIKTTSFILEKKLEKQIEIKKAIVKHKNIFELHIKIIENVPLYFDSTKQKTILKDGTETANRYEVPILLNYIPDNKYKKYLDKMRLIDKNTREKISEIKYSPNDKDDERFLLSMTDGNYVYLTLSKFEQINHYLEIMTKINKNFNTAKGILYLDSGGYFEKVS